MKEKIKNFYCKDICKYLILLIITIIFCIPMFNNKLNIYHDDGIQHIARAMGTEISIKEGTLFGNIINSFSNSFGYSWNLFYGPLSAFGIVVFKLLTGPYIIGYKLFMGFCLLLSGFMMYKLVNKITENSNLALLSGILYIGFPYHLTDLYTRNAVGEFVAFIFIPLVFLGLYNLLKTKDNYYYLPIGAIGLILTHNLTTAIVAFFAMIYVLINIKSLKENYVQKGLLISTLFILLCSAFYLVPMVETKLGTDYAVYEDGIMATKESFIGRALSLKQLFVTIEGEYSFEIGIHIIIMLAFTRMVYKMIKDQKNKSEYLFCFFAGIISIFMTTKYFPWSIFPEAVSIVQFPWRFMQIGMFFLCIVAAVNMSIVIKRFGLGDILVMTTVSVLLSFAVVLYPMEENKIDDWKYESLGIMTGKEYECVAGLGKEEYLPMKAYNNKFYIASREKGLLVLEGEAGIANEIKKDGKYIAEITVLTDGAKLEAPFIYYPGYEIRVDGVIIHNTFETDNGMLGFFMEQDEGAKIEIEYVGTNAAHISMIVSALGILALAVYVWKKH